MNAELSFGVISKNRRHELGLTQDELARRVGCAPITLRKIEADELRPSVQIAERMAMALNIPLEERSSFVKMARTERAPAEESHDTPMPAPEEIGIEDLSGRAIRGYALGEKLGNGGMGAVYRAVQPLVEREVAIKIILPQYANHPDFIRRFEAEAQLVARLEHPHIVPLYDYWREPGVAYLIMRLLRGGSLQGLLHSETTVSAEMILRIMEQIGSALSSAHRSGVVHRDLKPANVLLDEDGNAYLADFGIAKNLSSPSSETQADMVLGSPDYISPEQIRSEFVRPQTDIYALGVMFYELLTGKLPFRGHTPIDVMHQHLSTPMPPLSANRIGLSKVLDHVIEHATEKDPLRRYETVDEMLADVREALGGNRQGITDRPLEVQNITLPLSPMYNPYKGLRAFSESDLQDFFGRESLTHKLLVRLGESGELARFLAVVGPSGSGKSSVVKAGLIPTLRSGALPGSENWFIIEMTPGAHPLEELEAALLRVAVNPPASLMEQFQKDSRGLIRAVRRSLPDDPAIELLLVIDQFEEVFTLVQDESERLHFLGLLVSALLDEHSRIRVVITLRADFIDRPLAYVDFGELLNQRMEIVLPLTPDELERVIVAPAARVGLQLEPGLALAILRDVADQPGTLPLLQYALTELYEKQDGGMLTRTAYQSIGGALGALGRKSEEVFSSLDEEGRSIVKQLFLRLVNLGEGTEDTRRRVLVAELENLQLNHTVDENRASGLLQKILNVFGQARLLSFDRDPETRSPTVEVAHEAIIREWDRLRSWLNESRTQVRMQRQLALAASEWKDSGQDGSFLLTGTKLFQYEGWTVNPAIALTQSELIYLKSSIAERDKRAEEETERQRHELETAQKLVETERLSAARLRVRNRAISAVGLIALFLAVLAGIFAFNSEQNARHAEQEAILATSRELAAKSSDLRDRNFQLSILLGVEAFRLLENSQTRGAILDNANANPQLIQYLTGHTDWIGSVALNPDNTILASGGADNTVRLWNMKTRLPIGEPLTGHSDSVFSVAFSPNGKILASGSADTTIILWDMEAKQPIGTPLEGHSDVVTSVAFSPDGKILASGSNDNTIILWDVETHEAIGEPLAVHTDAVRSVAFSPDGKLLASGSRDNTIILWDVATRQPVGDPLIGHSNWVRTVAFSPDGKILASGGDDTTVILWDVNTHQMMGQPLKGHSDVVKSVTFSPDGSFLASGSEDRSIILWDVATGLPVGRPLVGHSNWVNSVIFTSNGKTLISGSFDKTIILWDLTVQTITGKTLAGHSEAVRKITFSPDGKILASGSDDGTIILWDVNKGVQIGKPLPASDMARALAFSPDGKILASGSEDGSIILWDVAAQQPIGSPLEGHSDAIKSLIFSHDGKKLFSGSSDNTIMIWDVAARQPIGQPLLGHSAPIRSLALSPDGKILASGSEDMTIILWDVATGQPIGEPLMGHLDVVKSVAFSIDGSTLASGAEDNTIILWDVKSGRPIGHPLTEHTDWVNSVDFDPSGKVLASAGYDKTIILWDWSTHQPIGQPIQGHTDIIYSIAFSPDGKLLASGSADKTIILWDMEPQSWLDLDCERVGRNFTQVEWQTYFPNEAYRKTCEQWPTGQ